MTLIWRCLADGLIDSFGDAGAAALKAEGFHCFGEEFAFAASVLVYAGATTLEASKLLRQTDPRTTLAHYARAQEEEGFDADRVSLRDETGLRLSERLEKLWEAWAAKFPKAAGKVAAVSAAHASDSHVVDLNQRRLKKNAARKETTRKNPAAQAST